MKYVIKNNKGNLKLANHNINLVGLKVIPKKGDFEIKAKEITIADNKLRESYIKQRVNKKIDKIINFMVKILNDDDSSDEDVGMVLDEVNKLKGIIIKKYKEYLCVSEYKSLITKLILMEEEFKKNYNQKMFSSYIQNAIYEEVISEGRGR